MDPRAEEREWLTKEEIASLVSGLQEQKAQVTQRAEEVLPSSQSLESKINLSHIEFNVFLIAPSFFALLWGVYFLISPSGFEEGLSWITMKDIAPSEAWGAIMVSLSLSHIGFSLVNRIRDGIVSTMRYGLTVTMMVLWAFIASSRFEAFPESPVWSSSAFFSFVLFLTLVREWARD
jgi:hypothetical protein